MTILSVLIPSYNYVCTPLVRALSKQAEAAPFAVEILVMDDASTKQETIEANREINRLPHCHFIENSINRGRAGVRNQLADTAKGTLLLFMDCDAGMAADRFLETYVEAWQKENVVCGGLLYERPLRNPKCSLRYRYGIQIEERSAAKRSLSPYDGFTTFSFLISQHLFLQIRFDESFNGYGHEDTVFGYELQKRQIEVAHIDNPLFHLGLETNEVFLSKTESSVTNLINADKELTRNTRLLQAYRIVYRYGLRRPMAIGFACLRPLLVRQLLGSRPSLTLFAFYKLGFICSLAQKVHSPHTPA